MSKAGADLWENFDFEAYISRYSSDNQLQRLLHMLKNSNSAIITNKAAMGAYEHLQGGRNTTMYRDLATKLFSKGFTKCTLDEAAVSEKDRDASRELEKLQTALGNAQNNLVKEQIRVALNDLSEFYFSRGDLHNAMKMVNRSRESCTTDANIFQLASNAIKFNLSIPNFAAIAQYLSKADAVVDRLGSDEFVFCRVTNALVMLDKRMYKSAANQLLQLRKDRATPAEFGSTHIYGTPGDFCMIATLCALATFDRTELEKFVGNPDLKVIYETEPELETLARSFYSCEYATALSALKDLMPRIKLDYFLQNHATKLVNEIRTAAMKQYTAPFSTLNLVSMAEAFRMDLNELRKDLGNLIQKGTIQARIDMANDVLYASTTDTKAKAFDGALKAADNFTDDAEDLMRLLSMQRNDVFVKQPSRHGGGGGGHFGGMTGGRGGGRGGMMGGGDSDLAAAMAASLQTQ